MRDPDEDYSTSNSGVNLNDAQPEHRRGSIDFANLIEPVARRLLGEPTSSTKDELRFGTKGSLSVNLKKGIWKSFETDEGGGCLDLIRRETSGGDPIKWLREQRLIREKTIVATFGYPDEQGTLLYQTYRQATGDIRVRRPDGRGGWIYNIDGVRRVLYRLPELLASTAVVYITEGEKHADRMYALGLNATCNVFGAGSARSKKWRPEYNEFLRNRDVVILPDNDDIGREHAKKIARNLMRVATRVRVLMLPDLKPKGDILNWLEAGGTVEELVRLTEECATWEETEPGSPEDGGYYERQYEPYYIQNGCIYWDKLTQQGIIPVRLSNFTAQITAEVKLDDGSGRPESRYSIKGSLGQAEVPVEKFNALTWVEQWGRRAIINPGNNHDRHLANAIKILSPDAAERTVYTHFGWREINGQLVYLHAGGAIGADGPVDGIEVYPGNSTLDKFILPPVTDLQSAIRCSLSLLEVAPARIVYPLWGAIYRAPLAHFAPMTVTVWVVGPTGVHKTSITLLVQAHYAPGITNVANWSSTANANERVLFLAKDTLVLVDDFAPRGTTSDIARLHNTAERNVRAQANQGGRLRMNPDATLKEAMYPRGGLLVTGEDVPRGQSLRARLAMVEMAAGDVDLAKLTMLQECAAAGLPAEAMSGYVSSLARQPDHSWVARREKELRAQARGPHARTPENVACLMVGIESGLRFAVENGVLSERDEEDHRALAWETLNELATAQETYLRSESPAERFVTLLQSILSSGRAHVADMNGETPRQYRDALGWREGGMNEIDVPIMLNGAEVIDDVGLPRMRRVQKPYYRAQGRQIGWMDEQFIYLIPDATYAEIQEHARVQNAPLGETQGTLWKALDAANLLAQKDGERRMIQRRICGRRPHVLCLHLRTVVEVDDPSELPF